jgi:hypothetical protein
VFQAALFLVHPEMFGQGIQHLGLLLLEDDPAAQRFEHKEQSTLELLPGRPNTPPTLVIRFIELPSASLLVLGSSPLAVGSFLVDHAIEEGQIADLMTQAALDPFPHCQGPQDDH